MARLTPREFATLIGITYNNLATYFNPPRNKFTYTIIENKKWVDTELPINAAFIKERAAALEKKGKKPIRVADIPDIPAERIAAIPKPETIKKNKEGAVNVDIFAIKEDLEVKKLEKITQEVFILELKKSKMAGEMVPFVLVQPITFQCLQYIHTQQKIADESFLNEVSHKYSISIEDMAYYRSLFIKGRNAAITTASNELITNLDNIMDTYKTKRDVGERN